MENKGSTAPGAKIHDRQLWTTWGVVALSSEFLGSVMLTVLVGGVDFLLAVLVGVAQTLSAVG